MDNLIKKALGWIGRALAAEITKPLIEQGAKIDALIAAQKKLDSRVTELHKEDKTAVECDLAIMDDRICHLIGVCRQRRYTTAEERRRITRLHEAYQARGGNHGEENEYLIFKSLPTEEEFLRTKGA